MDKASVFIARIRFARDPNSQIKARQFIVILKDENNVFFLETESTLNKERFDVNNRSEAKKYYHILSETEKTENNFHVETAVNCKEVFKCDYFPELINLKHREVSSDLIQKVIDKVNVIRSNGLNEPDVYITYQELLNHNPKLVASTLTN
ncbi:hypothetical protein K0018_06605 [Staphylococcus massiliensis]|uniref:hypothetical protein n=1 Tax=Staphylococcus massiliensis TaxID=555791 RepID=UPI001EDFD864|nr:hypothetical protein [Staphylococcus massiliensis]MCG3412735.1 hypothetical protein [Staphylococcus massiliensis]